MRGVLVLLLITVGLLSGCQSTPRCTGKEFARGSGCITFTDWDGPALNVWFHRPERATDGAPLVVVLHGMQRDAWRYRDEWRGSANEAGWVVVAPEFTRAAFPGAAAYNLGGLSTMGRRTSGVPASSSVSAFDAIEPLAAAVWRALGRTGAPSYVLYGHSAGAQFVHRYALFAQAPHLRMAIAANAGWYTFADPDEAFPYGFAGMMAEERVMDRALARPLLVLLGDADNDPGHESLRRTPEANRQGAHRLERGRRFFATAEALARDRRTGFGWQLEEVPGAGHDNALMLPAAVAFIIADEGER